MGIRNPLKNIPKPYTNEGLQVHDIDADKFGGFHEMFAAGESIDEGVSGRKSMDTEFDNLGSDIAIVERPASLHSGQPTPVGTDIDEYPHRQL